MSSRLSQMVFKATTNLSQLRSNQVRMLRTSSILMRKTDPSLPNLATAKEATKKTEIKRKFFERMLSFVETYGEKVLSNVLPKVAMDAVKLFSKGTKLLFGDMKEYTWVNHVLSETTNWQKACRSLSRKQLEVYLFLPGELLRVAPVLVLSAFPMAQNVVFPLAMMFPNRLLSSHFYSDKQLAESFLKQSRAKQIYYRSLLRDLHLSTSKSPDNALRKILSFIFKENQTPEADQLLKLRPLFSQDGPAHINKLSAPHVKHLLKTNRIRGTVLWFPRFRLQQYSNLVHQIDQAITREGGPRALPLDELRKTCHLRGLNIDGLSQEDMVKYVDDWLTVSLKLDVNTMSLLLHLPILLGYNHSSRIWDKWSVQ
jgi:hypothetical protein